ncbi:hypothetical protein ACP70R_006854 [Stipagrostis hirtigluma subsp. patula]
MSLLQYVPRAERGGEKMQVFVRTLEPKKTLTLDVYTTDDICEAKALVQ